MIPPCNYVYVLKENCIIIFGLPHPHSHLVRGIMINRCKTKRWEQLSLAPIAKYDALITKYEHVCSLEQKAYRLSSH